MQCSCGANAEMTSQVNRKCHAELRFYQCQQCGVVSDAVLSVHNKDVSWDLPGDAVARRWFVNLTPDSADDLYQQVTALANVFEEPEPQGAGEIPMQGDTHLQSRLF